MTRSNQGSVLKKLVGEDSRSVTQITEEAGMDRTYLYKLYEQEKIADKWLKKLKEIGIDIERHIANTVEIAFDTEPFGGNPEVFFLKDKIVSLENQLREKDRIIESKDQSIASKDQLIQLLYQEKGIKGNGAAKK